MRDVLALLGRGLLGGLVAALGWLAVLGLVSLRGERGAYHSSMEAGFVTLPCVVLGVALGAGLLAAHLLRSRPLLARGAAYFVATLLVITPATWLERPFGSDARSVALVSLTGALVLSVVTLLGDAFVKVSLGALVAGLVASAAGAVVGALDASLLPSRPQDPYAARLMLLAVSTAPLLVLGSQVRRITKRDASLALVVAVATIGIGAGLFAAHRRDPGLDNVARITRFLRRDLVKAEALYREGGHSHDGQLRYGTLAELTSVGLIDSNVATGRAYGYVFEARPSATTPEYLWMAVARPEVPGVTGHVFLAINHIGVDYFRLVEGNVPFELNDACVPAQPFMVLDRD